MWTGEDTSQAEVAFNGQHIPLHDLVDGEATSSRAKVAFCGHHISLHNTVDGEASSKAEVALCGHR